VHLEWGLKKTTLTAAWLSALATPSALEARAWFAVAGSTRTTSPAGAAVAASITRGNGGVGNSVGLCPRDLGGGRGIGLDVCVLSSARGPRHGQGPRHDRGQVPGPGRR
jgi:hypothetical protein